MWHSNNQDFFPNCDNTLISYIILTSMNCDVSIFDLNDGFIFYHNIVKICLQASNIVTVPFFYDG